MGYKPKTKPKSHQLEALMISKDLEAFALLMEMGTGKTKVAIDTGGYLAAKGLITGILVTCPKSLIGTWAKEEIPKHFSEDILHRIIRWKPNNKSVLSQIKTPIPGVLDILVMNVDAFNSPSGYEAAEAFLKCRKCLMVVDESTVIKSYDAQRTRKCIKLGALACYRRILTGTPVANGPMDVYSQFFFLDPKILGHKTYFTFRNRYAKLKDNLINGRSFKTIVGFQRLDELQQSIDKFSYRKLKSECLDLEPKIYQTRFIEMEPEQKAAYIQLKREALLELGDAGAVISPLAITTQMKLRQILCGYVVPTGETKPVWLVKDNPRIGAIMDIIEENPTKKVLIWCSFIPSIKEIGRRLVEVYGERAVQLFYGDLSADERETAKYDFQNDPDVRFMVLQNKTGGFGLTLTASSLTIYHDNDWSLEVRQQSEDRNHRHGQTEAVVYIDLVVEGTVDEKVAKALQEKNKVALEVTGDARRFLSE